MSRWMATLKRALPKRQKDALRGLFQRLLVLIPHRDNLELLAIKYGTDKKAALGGHGYVKYYDRYFRPLRKRALTLLEIGIGGYNREDGGASLRMWLDYFPRAKVHGLDLVDKRHLAGGRLSIHCGDQSDPVFLRQMMAVVGAPDIIIDDGSHVSAHVIASFEILFPLLAPGGIYVVEDVQTSYWPDYGGSVEAAAPTSMNYFKRLADGLNHDARRGVEAAPIERSLSEIHFLPGMIWIFKVP